MVQTILRRVLLAEMLFYALLTCWLVANDVRWLKIVGVVVLLALLWRLYLTLVSIVLAWLSNRREPVLPGGRGNAIKTLCREFLARQVCFGWSQAFPHLAMGKDPYGGSRGVPILLVHGHFSNRGLWTRFRKIIAAAGLGPIYTISLFPFFGDLDDFAEQLAEQVESIRAETRAPQVTLIGHSMGGLVCRHYLTKHSPARIAKLVTLGTPHHGSHYSRWLLGKNARQMRVGSDWLTRLADAEVMLQRPATLCIYGQCDEIISPPESSKLAWALNIEITAVGHFGLVFSEVVAREVIRFLDPVERQLPYSPHRTEDMLRQ